MRTRYKTYQNNQPYFITMTTVNWVPLFTKQAIFAIVFNSLRFLISNNIMTIFAYVVVENHVHIIGSSENLSNGIRRFKSFTAREIIDSLKSENKFYMLKQLEFGRKQHKYDQQYQVWQEGYHPQLMQSNEMMIQKIEYIHNNPVKRGYIDKPESWRYSSARNYIDGDSGDLGLELFVL